MKEEIVKCSRILCPFGIVMFFVARNFVDYWWWKELGIVLFLVAIVGLLYCLWEVCATERVEIEKLKQGIPCLIITTVLK